MTALVSLSASRSPPHHSLDKIAEKRGPTVVKVILIVSLIFAFAVGFVIPVMITISAYLLGRICRKGSKNQKIPILEKIYPPKAPLHQNARSRNEVALFKACQDFDWPSMQRLVAEGAKMPPLEEGKPHPLTESFRLFQRDLDAYYNTEDLNEGVYEKLFFLLRVFNLVSPNEEINRPGYAIALAVYPFFWSHNYEVPWTVGSDLEQAHQKLRKLYFKEFFLRSLVGLTNGIRNRPDFPFYEGSPEAHGKQFQLVLRTVCERCTKRYAAQYDAVYEVLTGQRLQPRVGVYPHIKTSLFSTGFRDHAVEIALDSRGYLVICNTGAGSRPRTFKAYRIDYKKITPEIWDKLTRLKEGNQSEFCYYIYFLLPYLLQDKEQDEVCHAIETISPESQRSGNCYFAALFGGIRAVLALNELTRPSLQTAAQLEDAAKLAKSLSEVFETDVRDYMLKTYKNWCVGRSQITNDTYLISRVEREIQERKQRERVFRGWMLSAQSKNRSKNKKLLSGSLISRL